MRRRSLWRRIRRATREPRNSVLSRAILGAAWLLGKLPVPVALAIGGGLGRLAHRVLGRPRRLARAHVALALPELDAAMRRRLVRDTFVHAGQSFAELALAPKLRTRMDWFTVEGREALDAALAEGRGAIVVTGHVGNWELLAAAVAAAGYPISVVVRRVTERRFHAIIVRFRRTSGIEVLVRDDPRFLASVGDALRRNRIVAMLIDQDTRGPGVFVPFFGRLARTPPGAAVLALRARAPVLAAFIRRRPGGGHVVTCARVPIGADRSRAGIVTLTARLTQAIEVAIRRSPAEWVWWHERWRHAPEPASAPVERAVSPRPALLPEDPMVPLRR